MASVGFFARLEARRDITAMVIRDAMINDVPSYAELGRTALLDNIHDMWWSVLNRARASEPLTEVDLEIFREFARSRALDDVPLDDLRLGIAAGYIAGLRDCLADASVDEDEEISAFLSWGALEQNRVARAQIEAYVITRGSVGDLSQVRELLVKQLIEGTSAIAAAAAAGVTLSTGYVVLLCGLAPSERLDLTEVQLSLAERALSAVPGVLWLNNLRKHELLVLVPAEIDVDFDRSVTADLVANLSNVIGSKLSAVEAHACTLERIPDVFDEVRQAMRCVSALPDSRNYPYSTDDLLVELAMVRQPALLERLVNLLSPLRQGTDLLHTVDLLFACGLDREKTTKALHVHRRTLTYRIQRIRELTGLDLTTAHGIQLLRAALTASRLSPLKLV